MLTLLVGEKLSCTHCSMIPAGLRLCLSIIRWLLAYRTVTGCGKSCLGSLLYLAGRCIMLFWLFLCGFCGIPGVVLSLAAFHDIV